MINLSKKNETAKQRKIFGIGLSRTGTTSCYHLMKFFEFSSVHYPRGFQDIDTHVFSNDSPVSSRFEILDQRYPESIFIYTIRNLDEWTASCMKSFPRQSRLDWVNSLTTSQRQWCDYGDVNLYGYDMIGLKNITAKELATAYHRHEQRVYDYFKETPLRLLEIDLTNKASLPLSKLTKFIEQNGFIGVPHTNKAEEPFSNPSENSGEVC